MMPSLPIAPGKDHFSFMAKKGFTLIEIVIATFILSVIMLGLVSVFISSKKVISYHRSRVVAGELGKAFLDPLQSNVTQSTWGTSANCLSQVSCPNLTMGTAVGLDKTYTANYTITSATPAAPIGNLTGNLTRVKVNINWTERAP
jgi:prepilin-type N-terminal cleavage/methylation domain-containing protein